ncbi:MAG: hypothetical protein DRN19_06285 [Thermoplasmata archaeon]|nr:MAG: hypothetical protein DRN19_06285 [Thermoplasmata archaeon]
MAIRASLYDSSKNVQITAAEYLGKLKDKESLQELIELFKKDSEPMLRVSILHALREIKEGFKIKDIIKMVLPEKKGYRREYNLFARTYEISSRFRRKR